MKNWIGSIFACLFIVLITAVLVVSAVAISPSTQAQIQADGTLVTDGVLTIGTADSITIPDGVEFYDPEKYTFAPCPEGRPGCLVVHWKLIDEAQADRLADVEDGWIPYLSVAITGTPVFEVALTPEGALEIANDWDDKTMTFAPSLVKEIRKVLCAETEGE